MSRSDQAVCAERDVIQWQGVVPWSPTPCRVHLADAEALRSHAYRSLRLAMR